MADPERVRWHLAQAKKNAQDAIDGRARLGNDWMNDPVTKAGITKLVETTADYMGNIPLEIQAQFPDEYHRLDVEIVESTIEVDLPKLIKQIDQILAAI